eukprot:CAMPEP_0119547944 /NCGR_PEP_ID=MMETSP1352-20130426/1965_1 /TAXON_ID=265584 /ORGANISM="Stauroneis constricta, Strain CCMP1120" /LENGTH=31 /DNA_ID= /DNA_START= /DNA_END= /DNA_ORIENTATION=
MAATLGGHQLPINSCRNGIERENDVPPCLPA